MNESGNRMTQRDNPPTDSAICEWIGKEAYKYWQHVMQRIEQIYPNVFTPEWLFGGKKHGWSLRYKKNKSFCTFIPEKNRFALLIVFGAEERVNVEAIRNHLSRYTQKEYDEATTYHDGKWLLLTIDTDEIVADVIRLLAVKRRARKHIRTRNFHSSRFETAPPDQPSAGQVHRSSETVVQQSERRRKDMTVIGINGSPRKNWNTATLLMKALEGAASQGAATELVHLYDLNFKGCTSCFACKIINGPYNGKCAMQDDLSPILKKIEEEAEALILGTPVYFGAMSGEMRCFLERLLFAPLVYRNPPRSAFPRQIRTGIIYTMNVTEKQSAERHYEMMFNSAEASLRMVFGAAETFRCYDTCQFPDYSKVVMEYMDPVEKAARREKVFPDDCRKAFEFGCRMASGA